MRKVSGVNTQISEQTFAWFRHYAFTFNSMRPLRHEFLVHLYCRLHNEQIDSGDRGHLTPICRIRKQKSVPYPCSGAKKVMKAMKRA